MTTQREETPMQEVQRLRWIENHYAKLSPAGKDYIRKWMVSGR